MMLPCVTFSVMKNLLVSTFAKEDQSLGATALLQWLWFMAEPASNPPRPQNLI